jgi:adenylosuccinate synthase
MPSLVLTGAQWGDEGKGKLVDFFTEKAEIVVRFHGGNNAGHTLVVDGVKTKLSLIPSGILREHAVNLIGAGVVLDGYKLAEEISQLKEAGIEVTNKRLLIDSRCELILPFHPTLDKCLESFRGADKIDTTGKGIGPAYADRASRDGFRVGELRHLDKLSDNQALKRGFWN